MQHLQICGERINLGYLQSEQVTYHQRILAILNVILLLYIYCIDCRCKIPITQVTEWVIYLEMKGEIKQTFRKSDFV